MKSKGNCSNAIENDTRFSKIATNPLFAEMRRKDRKIVIDERFQQIFTDDRFKMGSFKKDKRGRKFDLSSSDRLANLYDLKKSDDEESSSADDTEEENNTFVDDEASLKSLRDIEEEDEDLIDIKLDLARGEGNVLSSSSSSEDDEDDEVEKESSEDNAMNSWGEMDRSVKRVEWASRRIAICNLEWDRLRADDLLIVLNSFKPSNGFLHSVSIYLSDFGDERIEEENKKGPKLKAFEKKEKDENVSKEAIRAYQLDRLRYYYAVCECDSEETAMAIYENCDGVEYETSGVRFDIRFVPAEMEFDEIRLREKVSSNDINVELYKPKKFESYALSNAEAKLTWDETDPERVKSTRNAFKEESNLRRFENLLAPASDSEENDDNAKKRLNLLLTSDNALVQNLDNDNSEKEDLCVEWSVSEGKKEQQNAGSDVNDECKDDVNDKNNNSKNETIKKLTPFQEYLERRKQKRRERKAQIQEAKRQKKQELEDLQSANKKKSTKNRNYGKNDSTSLDLGDSRFSALFSDSAFAIDKTNSLFKGGELANRQAEAKSAKRSRKESRRLEINADEDVVSRKRMLIDDTNNFDDLKNEPTSSVVERLKGKMGKFKNN